MKVSQAAKTWIIIGPIQKKTLRSYESVRRVFCDICERSA